MEIIHKSEIQQYLSSDFLFNYNEKFMGTGNAMSVNNLFAGVVLGIKNDTLYNILLVFENDQAIAYAEKSMASFYKTNNAIHEEFIVGRIYFSYSQNYKCLTAFLESNIPYKVDTLKDKWMYSMFSVKSRDSLEFCP